LFGLAGRARLDQLLPKAELETVLAYQRKVISSLPHPPAGWLSSYPEPSRRQYLENFDPNERYMTGNLWHRYQSPSHLKGWLELMAQFLPDVLQRVARMDPQTIYIGAEIDLDTNPLSVR